MILKARVVSLRLWQVSFRACICPHLCFVGHACRFTLTGYGWVWGNVCYTTLTWLIRRIWERVWTHFDLAGVCRNWSSSSFLFASSSCVVGLGGGSRGMEESWAKGWLGLTRWPPDQVGSTELRSTDVDRLDPSADIFLDWLKMCKNHILVIQCKISLSKVVTNLKYWKPFALQFFHIAGITFLLTNHDFGSTFCCKAAKLNEYNDKFFEKRKKTDHFHKNAH